MDPMGRPNLIPRDGPDPSDVEVISRPSGTRWQVILVHEPTQTRVDVTEASELLARTKAWMRLRDRLDGRD